MKAKLIYVFVLFLLSAQLLNAQKSYEIISPDGNTTLKVDVGPKLLWSVKHKGQQLIEPSAISLQLEDGEMLGDNARIDKADKLKVNTSFKAIDYIKAVVPDEYDQLTLNCRGDFGVIFRVYNDAVAYRFFTKKKGEIQIKNEEANFNFSNDDKAYVPYIRNYHENQIFCASFESLYTVQKISEFKKDSIAFLPLLVDLGNGSKAEIVEADLESYPGMFLSLNETGKGYKGLYAPYPLEAHQVGINYIPTKRADYIAKVNGTREFPWRAVVISEEDKDLLNNDIIQKLASPCRLNDISWIKPGQASWDWWNDLNISHVSFRAGINTDTYKYFIDFAAANHIKYILMDAGWSGRDLLETRQGIDLPEIIRYANENNVGIFLWTGWHALVMQLDTVFEHYSKMGIKGFKIDFFDRDDQLAVESTYELAKKAAAHHLLIDFHGISKPTGLQRTYPNVVGYEGVKGMENEKWANDDVPRYDVTIPYIRNLAGPMDYTPGAMRNANRANYRAINSNPMSQGTRCHQLAMYVVFHVPFQMLADNPTIYSREQLCTDFITSVPTTFDETVPMNGEVGEYVAVARRKDYTWYVGAMTNWSPRKLTLDFSFLPKGEYRAVIFEDGINADRQASDYNRKMRIISSGDKMDIQLSTGGGWAARLTKIK